MKNDTLVLFTPTLLVSAAICAGITMIQVSAKSPSEKAQPSDTAQSVRSNASPSRDIKGTGVAALECSARDGKYLFIFFFRDDDAQTKKLRAVLDGAISKISNKANSIVIKQTDSDEKAIIRKFGVEHSQMPLLLSVAPNGAVTKGMSRQFNEQNILDSLVGSGQQQCLKALQDHKMVLLCLQNQATKSNVEALKGVNEFKADKRYGKATVIVKIDPRDPNEERFLRKLQIDPRTNSAITVLLAPPQVILAQVTGKTKKDTFLSAIQSASSGCGAGSCGAGSCK